MINPHIFRAYDIRGTAEPTEKQPLPDLTPETAQLIGQATATYLIRQYNAQNLLIGRDNRLHSEKLQQAFIQGALKTGLNVEDCGLTSSPMIYFASCHFQADSAVNVTASHNPRQDNGFKVVQKNASSVADQELQSIYQLILDQDFIQAPKPGQLTLNQEVFTEYQKKILATIKLARPLKVVIDAGNGVTGIYAPAIFRALGCEVIELFCELDGTFPNHEANPELPKNMVDLGKKVVETGADLGIGFDGDGDRLGIVDEKGQFYSAEYNLMLLARDLLEHLPGEKIIFDVKVCNALIEDIKKHNGIPLMARVGHSYMERRLAHENATLAGEKSGHMFFGSRYYNYYGFDDAIFAAAKIVEILSHHEKTYYQMFSDIPCSPSLSEFKVYCPDSSKTPIIESLTNYFSEKYPCITLDGVRMSFEDGAWALIRSSNTSPALTVFAEATTTDRLDEIKQLLLEQLKQHPEAKLP